MKTRIRTGKSEGNRIRLKERKPKKKNSVKMISLGTLKLAGEKKEEQE